MINVAIVFSGDSKALNGAALYVNRFKTIEEELKSVGLLPIICDYNKISNHASSNAEITEIEKEYASSKTHAAKNKIKKLLSHTYIGNKLFLQLAWEHPGKKSIELNSGNIRRSDVILANDIFSAYYSIKKFPHKPLVFIMHNSGELLRMLESRLPHIKGRKTGDRLEAIAKEIFEKSKKIVFVSRKAQELFNSQHPQYVGKTAYIPVGIVDTEYNSERPTEPVSFVCVGTVCTRKNQLSIVKAMRNVDAEKALLTIVGGGEKLQECIAYIEENGLKNVRCLGTVESIIEYLNSASVFIMASLDEGLPAVGVEALRAGLPILTTNVGGCGELIQDNGALISDTTPEAIAVAINTMIDKKDEIPRMSRNSRKLYEKEFSIGAMVAAYKKILGDEDYGE